MDQHTPAIAPSHRRLLVTGGSGFIGTHLVEHALAQRVALINVDVEAPLLDHHRPVWQECDILNTSALHEVFIAFEPTHVVHLAARTDTDAQRLEAYRVNIEGTANVLDAIKHAESISRVVITSTQFVCGPGRLPQHDEDFSPHTVYGQSKVIAEQLTRESDLADTWTIIRPTNIWGPWHPRYPYEFWRVLKKGWYVHPGRAPVMRSYGYVKNVVHQIEQILDAPPEQVHRRVFYLGDRPINLFDWVNGFSRAITGHDVLVIPRSLVRALALLGDGLSLLRPKFPIHTSRFRSMTQDYLTPMEPTLETFGEPPYSLDEGIEETVSWLRTQDTP